MKTSDFSTLYHVNPVVSDLNRVPGFDPLNYVRATKGGLVLDLPYKKLWFRLKYPNGIVRPLLVEMTDKLAIIEARVFFDRRDQMPAASFIAQCRKDESERGDYIKAAQNSAIDQALSDAGFGVQFVPAEPENTAKTEVETVKSAEQKTSPAIRETQPAPEKQPMTGTATVAEPSPTPNATEEKTLETGLTATEAEVALNEEPAQAAETKPETPPAEVPADDFEKDFSVEEGPTAKGAPAYTEETPVEQIVSLMTREEAENYVVKEGTCSGWTMAQVADRRPFSLKFYLNGYQGKDNILRAAAMILTQKAA